MTRSLLLFLLVGMASGCQEIRQNASHVRSSVFGLNRVVTLYSASGEPLRSWRGNFQIESDGGGYRFLCEGRAVTISGTVVIEEVR